MGCKDIGEHGILSVWHRTVQVYCHPFPL